MPKKPLPLRSLPLNIKITGMVLLLFLCSIWVLTLFISKRLEHKMTAQIEAQQFSIASYIADSIESQVKLRINSLTAIANIITPELLANPGKLREFLHARPLLLTLFQTGVSVVSREGTGIADYPVLPGRTGGSVSDLEYFKEVIATGKPAVGKPRIGRFSKKPVISFGAPVMNSSGKLIAVLAGHTLLSDPALLGSFNNLAYKDFSDRLTLVSPRYRLVVTGTDPARIMTPTPEPGVSLLHDKFMAGFEGSGIYVNSRGIRMLSSGKQIPTPGWFVRVGLPTEMALAPIRSMKNSAYSMALVLSLISSFFVWLVIRQALRPLYAATKLIHDITEKRLPLQDIPVTKYDEVGQLLGSFNEHFNYRKKSEEALRKSEEKFRVVTSSLAEGIYVLNEQGNIFFMNPEAERLLGRSFTELFGKNAHEILHYKKADGSPLPLDECGMRNVIKTGIPFVSRDEVFVRKDGTVFPISVVASPIMENGKVIAAVTAFRDITERKRIESERDKLIVELREALARVKQLSGLLPICASCKKIRNDEGFWEQVESYISEHSEALFSHGICPECGKKLYPEYYDKIWGEKEK